MQVPFFSNQTGGSPEEPLLIHELPHCSLELTENPFAVKLHSRRGKGIVMKNAKAEDFQSTEPSCHVVL